VSSDSLSIDDFGPLSVRRPASVGEVCDLVREALDAGQGLYPVGGRTALDVGLPPIKHGFALDTTALHDVIDYPARDMTITVRAGITMEKLQETLAAENQWLPVDVPNPERATLGGAVALNQSGPRRFGHGTLRDYVIGISFVTDEGVEVKAGGRVVKNVAGYDLMKLQIGALGTLGVVTQLTLKVKPRPEVNDAIEFGCELGALGAVLDGLHASKARPTTVELFNDAAWRSMFAYTYFSAPWVLAVGFEEKATTVQWQVGSLLDELKGWPVAGGTEDRGPGAAALWSAAAALQSRPESRFILKASVPPSRVAEFLAAPFTGLVHAEALNGIVWLHGDETQLAGLEGHAAALGGNAVWRRCLTERKRTLPVWGRRPDAWDLMRHVKRTLDPNDVFNPGRLFGDV
jgi:glycolate oxidase FAD binding subunit